MLEGFVASLLNRFLGLYIKNFDPKQLNIGIWSGDVKLRDLELRREALDQLNLPINVIKGYLGELTLRIPWSNLRGQSVQIQIKDVYVLAAPREDAEWNEEEEEKRRQALKIEKLESAEILKEPAQENLSQEEQQKNQSFTESLVTKIVDNIHITIKNIHIRYEDSISYPNHPFAIGVTLQEFSAVSTDGEWKPTFIQNSVGSTHKLITLGALAIYWNSDTKLLEIDGKGEKSNSTIKSSKDVLEEFKSTFEKGYSQIAVNHQFILKPVNGLAKIQMNKSGRINQPHINAKLVFDEIGMVLDDYQYRDALMMVDLFHCFNLNQEFKKLRPKHTRPKEDPRAWLIFACNSILGKIHDRHRRWSWEFFKERRDNRLRYIELFKQKKKHEIALTVNEQSELSNLERKLDFDDLRFWRSLARSQLRKENAVIKKTNTAKKSQGWVAWVWGSKPDDNEDNSESVMTEEQRKELYDAIEWDEKSALAETIDLPKETIKIQVSASLNTGSFTLKRDPHGDEIEVLSLYFDGFSAKYLQRPESFLTDISLEGLRVNDGTVPNSLFTQIVRVKDAPNFPAQRLQITDDIEIEDSVDPFFEIKFEKNPLDGKSDMALIGKLKPLEIIWNSQFLVGIVEFFRPPERHMESIEAFIESAGATVESFRKQTRAGLEFALEEHKTLNAILDLQAPLVIIPESITEKRGACLILDAGHISVNSQIVDKNTLKQVQEKQSQSYSAEDYHRLQSLMYDKFLVKLSSAQLLIGPSLEETRSQIYERNESTSMHVVEKTNIDFMVETSIIPKVSNLAKLRVSGRLPLLHVSASDKKYKSLMRIIDVAIPKFEEAKNNSNELDVTSKSRNQINILKFGESKKNLDYIDFQPDIQDSIINQVVSHNESSKNLDVAHKEVNENLKLQQHNFELNFEVERLQGSLFRSGIEGHSPDQLLVELVAENFALKLIVRPFDVKIDTSLRSLTVDDHVENSTDEFQSIISSGDFGIGDVGNLISVSIVVVNNESPELLTNWDGMNVNIKVIVSTINLIVTRKTLLTLLDFILVTFTTTDTLIPNQRKIEKEPENYGSTFDSVSKPKVEAMAVQIKVDLKSILMILNNDGNRLATLSLNNADVGIFVMGNTLRIDTKVADLTLLDDMHHGSSEDPIMRKLITIQGDDLADFRYETFDPEVGEKYPGYDSSVYLRAGSIKLNFLEEPIHNIIGFLVRFGKMQAIFNAARQAAANQASQIQQNAGRMKVDIHIKTPIVVFPRSLDSRPDTITAHLGEIYAENKFIYLDESKSPPIAMKLSTGIRNIRLTSNFYFSNDENEEIELIDRLDLDFVITYSQHMDGDQRPELEVEGKMTDINLRITQTQLNFMLNIIKSFPTVLVVNDELPENDINQENSHGTANLAIKTEPLDVNHTTLVDLGPELRLNSQNWTKLDLAFHVNTIGLELILATENEPVKDIAAASLSRFSLDNTRVKFRMTADGSIESEFLVHSMTIQDSRTQITNKFRKIMTSTNKDVQQFMASITISGGVEQNIIAIMAIDSPRIIFALDYIFALQSFLNKGLAVDNFTSPGKNSSTSDLINSSDNGSIRITKTKESSLKLSKSSTKNVSATKVDPENKSYSSFAFRVNIVDAQIILIANPIDSNSEAIVLGAKQILMSQQNAFTLQIDEIGMYLCRMDRFEDIRLQIIDDFSAYLSLDSSNLSSTNVEINLEPLILRLSLRDILLALQIISKASELSGTKDGYKNHSSPRRSLELRKDSKVTLVKDDPTDSTVTALIKGSHGIRSSMSSNYPIINPPHEANFSKKEELTANLQGIRLILIGDLHELPILDLSVKRFKAIVNNWSSNIRASATIEMLTNIYNFSKSVWEPFMEPWGLSFSVKKEISPDSISVDLKSSKILELTVSSAMIALASKSAQFLTQKYDVLSKSRGVDAPYRIRNYTGYDLTVLASYNGHEKEDQLKANFKDGVEGPWRFQDWETVRENISSDASDGIVEIKLEGSGFEKISKIPINREGEYLFCLQPQKDRVFHRILVEIVLGANNVKYVTFRSPLSIENNTLIPVEMGVLDAQGGDLLRIEKILPGESRPAPIGFVYTNSLSVRPNQGFGYNWSTEKLWWNELIKKPTRTLTCESEQDGEIHPFYFQMHASIDRSNPLTNIYPYMKIRISAPIELENLLPYNFKYRIYDKNTKKDWTNFLRKNGVSPLHVVELSHLLLMSIEMQDTPFKASEFSVINPGNNDDFRRENTLVCKDNEELSLNLRLHYYEIPNSGCSFRVTVYSPYVILNKTGLRLHIKAKSLLSQAKTAAGQAFYRNLAESGRQKAYPYLFAFGGDDQRNRAILKIGESSWSKPQSFDAIGSSTEVILPSVSNNTEIHIGITIKAGEGKYKLTKVVTIAPRFILKNQISEEISVREPGSSKFMVIKPQALQPLYFLQKSTKKQLSLCYSGLNNKWSSPFNISDLGTIHIKVAKQDERQKLVRVEVLMENSTMFLHLSMETGHWPFSIRNESDTEFMFFQANPNFDDDDYDITEQPGWRPIRYKLPPRSIMPYAWDYPAARKKELVIHAYGIERHVKLAEIGNLIPMKIPASRDEMGNRKQKIIDLNVTADGPTQRLTLSNYRASKSLYRPKLQSDSIGDGIEGFEVKNQDTSINFKAQLHLAGVGISLINTQPIELAYITLREIIIKYSESPLYQTFIGSINWVQIDNQLYGGIFPMILYPSIVPQNSKESRSHPSVHAMLTRVKDDSYGVLYIKYATVLLQQMTLEIDEDFIYSLLEFSKVPGASWSETQESILCDESLDLPEPKQNQSGQDIYFELLNIQPMQLDLSFVRTDRVNVEDKTSSRNPLIFLSNVLTMAIGNINDAPVRFNSLMIENARVSAGVLLQNFSNHYSQEALYQIHKVIGSADFLGNPVGLFNNISSGVADIFYEPYLGFIMADGPEDLGIGIAKGATSFVKKSVFGVSDSVSKFTGSIAKGLAEATMDKQFQDRRRMTRSRNRPKHALYGVTAGANSFVSSLASGVGGLARKPLEGAEQEGLTGFFKGVGKGALGFVTKPAIGIFDLASNVSEGIRNTTTVFDAEGLDRVRLTRFIDTDGIVRPYSQREALGQFWLKQLNNGKYFNEHYIAHLELPREDVVVILTYTRILLVKSKRLKTEWDVPFNNIQTISKERTGLGLTLRGGINGPFIPAIETSSRNFLYRKIGIAVENFNQKYKAK
ncbi:Vacuolar protein sorting-associated protein 13 [Erysiphe neolycopersici]|uniref:Vacuolar protein sorting-associated protein n=1 Tax=Erysiphe neolycopersici TaxID=212602 RepID=A0A420HM74_9PEZI|nr:Vacuolar protein sorting-associated protein 13 [Erysiphe neolycopersici]